MQEEEEEEFVDPIWWISNESNEISILPTFIVPITNVRDHLFESFLATCPAGLGEIILICSLRSTSIRVSLLRRGLRESLIEP